MSQGGSNNNQQVPVTRTNDDLFGLPTLNQMNGFLPSYRGQMQGQSSNSRIPPGMPESAHGHFLCGGNFNQPLQSRNNSSGSIPSVRDFDTSNLPSSSSSSAYSSAVSFDSLNSTTSTSSFEYVSSKSAPHSPMQRVPFVRIPPPPQRTTSMQPSNRMYSNPSRRITQSLETLPSASSSSSSSSCSTCSTCLTDSSNNISASNSSLSSCAESPTVIAYDDFSYSQFSSYLHR